MMKNFLTIKDLKKYFKTKYGLVRAVDGIYFNVEKGETFALVGESGSGKSTTGHLIVGMYAPTSGEIYFKDKNIAMHASKRPMHLRREIQIVFQDPASSLNPSKYVKDIVSRPLRIHGLMKNEIELREKVAELLEGVELTPEYYMYRKPKELGGGELQAIAIARALSTNPELIILDEPTSALDVLTQVKIIKLLLRLQQKLNLTYIFITHDLAVVRNMATRVAVMYLGEIVEMAPTDDLFMKPQHPYTLMLFSSIPVVTDEEKKIKPQKVRSIGEIPSALAPPLGCRFHTRCPLATNECKKKEPVLDFIDKAKQHLVACHQVR